ncbi:MAG: hypothetical protein L0220_18475 [Acidobacteria bacterium]|nr:hypothetical protein [Acidobacteriota bacterium]
MGCIPNLILVSSIIFVSAAAGLAQAPSPPPPQSPKLPPLIRIPRGPEGIPVESWQEFKHEVGNFAVTMPGKPLEMSQTIETDVGKVPTKVFIANEGRISFMAMYADYPLVIDTPENIKPGLDDSRDMMLSKLNGKLISEKEYVFKKYPGRELKAKTSEGLIRLRMYLVKRRLYIVGVLARGTDDIKLLESAKPEIFFDSFQLIKNPPATATDVALRPRFESAIADLTLPSDFHNRPVSWR